MFKKTAVLALAVLVIAAAILAGAWLVFRPGVQPVAANKLPPRPPAAAPAAPAAPASAALRAQAPQADPAAGGTKAEMRFTRYFTDTSKEQPQACLQFSEPLVESGAINYQDYLRFSPTAKVALNVAKDRLCIGGLGFGRDYKVTIAAGLPAQSGDKTAEDETQTVGFGDRPALVAFAGNGFILPRQGSNGLALETINVSKVKLAVTRIGDRNLARSAFGRNSKGEPYYYNPDSSVAAPVWTGEMPIASVHNERVTTIIPLADVIKTRRPGAYIVTAKKFAESGSGDDDDDRSGVAVQWVVDTDLALTAMRGADGLHVFVRSLDTAKPVAKVNLALIAENNDQLGTAETDADGHAAFAAGLTRGAGPLRPKMVMAYGAEDDFAALDLSRAGFDLTDRGVGGREAPGPVDAFVYTDRGVYRPGETVQLVALLRDSLGTAVADTPVTAIVLRPDGVEAKRVQLDAAPAGGFHLPYGLSATAARGLWSARISVDGGKHTVGSAVFDVEDFVPQRLKVAVTASATFLKPGAATPLAIDSRYLYGAPAAGLAAEGELKLKVDPSPYPAAKGYRFGLVDDKFKPEIRPLEIGKTDDAGKTALALDVAPLPKTTQPLAAEIDVGVVEPGGRVTPSTITLPIRNLTLAIGIRPRFTGDRVQENAAAAFDVIALDEAGTPVARQGLDYSFIHEVTSYDWYYTDDRAWHYQRIVHDRPIADGKLDVAADKPAELNHAFDWGSYRLEVRDRTSGAATSIRFWAGWGATVERDTPDTVQVTANRDRAKPGEPVTITIHPPFAGEVQIAVATDSVLETRTLFVPAEGTSIEVTASEQWGAGAYVLATLYRPQSAVKVHEPVRAIGLTWVPLDQLAHTLGVALGAPNLARPRGTLDVPVKISGAAKAEPVYVTLAAVDEGILQLTDFISPDPNEYYFGKRRLGVDIRDDYARLLQNGGGQVGVLRQGGDSGGGAGLSVVPTETVALFSGVLAVGADGTVHVPLQIPSFNGEIRLMAVAYGAHALGRAEAHVTVRDPVVAELILPRFLAPGDAASATLQLHNVEGAAGTYHAAVEASGAVGSGTFSADYDLPSGAEITAAVPLAAGDPGIGHFQLSVNGPGGFSVTRTWNLEVRTPRFPITLADTALQAPGTAYRFDPRLLDAFLPGTASVSIGYAGFKGIDVPGLLQSLDRYPYGCSEQTTSRALPLLVFNDLSLLAGVKTDQEIRGRVQQAIDTLLERQDAEGSFGLWRSGDGAARPWLGAYITDFLVRAKEHGYVVPDTALDAAYRSMAQVTQGQGNYDYGTYYRSEYRQLVKL
ncbi:MAG TPA: alpha-2-macroglobulin, partial [Candidatus Cybelea sp.]|nr:alpha-2-macroglobulin [Candidatus Cybelea sp.]